MEMKFFMVTILSIAIVADASFYITPLLKSNHKEIQRTSTILKRAIYETDEFNSFMERATAPDTWTCPPEFYDAQDGCDCECGAYDPDCDTFSPPFGCQTNLNWTCNSTGNCVAPTPNGWTCDLAFYNNSDGCDCNCGVQDPDCDANPDTTVYNCEEEGFLDPRCVRGLCEEKPLPPVRVDFDDVYIIRGSCGKVLTRISPDDYAALSVNASTVLPPPKGPGIVLLDSNFAPISELLGGATFSATASVVALDPSQQNSISIVGRTTVPILKGAAVFNNIVVLGPADAEFNLVVGTNPKLISAESFFPVKIQEGDAVSVRISFSTSKVFPNGTLAVAADMVMNASIALLDDCGNVVKKNPPFVTCIAVDHNTLLLVDGICQINDPFATPAHILLTMPSTPGVYDVFFINDTLNSEDSETQRLVVGSKTFEVQPKSEYQCYKLIDSAAGVTGDDIVAFDKTMISQDAYIQITEKLFSVDTDRPNILTFLFNSSTKGTPYHTKLNDTLREWNLAAKHFFVEQDPRFLQVISLGLVEVQAVVIESELVMPFCGSITPEIQKRIIGQWLFSLSDAFATFEQNQGSTNPNSTIKVQSTNDVVCIGDSLNYTCCDRIALISGDAKCFPPAVSTLSIALVIISILFAVIASSYATVLVFVFFQQSGAIYTAMEDLTTLSEVDLRKKTRINLLVTIFAPILMGGGMAQSILLINADKPYANFKILVGVIEGVAILYWYVTAGYHFGKVFWKHEAPSPRADILYFVGILEVVWFSLFNVFWTFSWVTLGLLLNPGRVVAYFVAFLTVFAVAVLKIQSLVELMKQVELSLHKELFKRYMKAHGKEFSEEEFEAIESVNLELQKLVVFFREKGLGEADAEKLANQIQKFRRFRVRFLIGNLFGTIFLLTALIVFILLGVEAFRTSSGAVSSVGSALEALSGAGSVVNEKLGDKQQDIRELVQTFAKMKGARGGSAVARPESISPNVELTTVTSDD